MTNINNNLNNLFKNYQNQQKYNKKKYDVNGDGKINSKDQTALTNEKNSLLKDTNIFDVNNDDKIDMNDLLKIADGFDVDGDGAVSKEENSFFKSFSNNIVNYIQQTLKEDKALQKDIDDFNTAWKQLSKTEQSSWSSAKTKVLSTANSNKFTGINEEDGKYYYNGSLADKRVIEGKYCLNGVPSSGYCGGKYYDENGLVNGFVTVTEKKKEVTYMCKNGVKLTGISDIDGKCYSSGLPKTGSQSIKENGKYVSYYFVNGEKAQGSVKIGSTTYLFKDGQKFTGLNEDEGLYYNNGSLLNSSIKIGNTTINAKKGVLQYSIIDNNKNSYPYASGQSIRFKNGSKYVTVKLEIGSSATINEDGTVEVINKDNELTKYDKNGQLITSTIKFSKSYGTNGKVSLITAKINGENITLDRTEIMSYLNSSTKEYISKYSTADVTDRLLKDILIVKYAETIAEKVGKKGSEKYNTAYNSVIKSQMIKTESNMTNSVGEVVEKNDGLYVNDGSELVKLNISAETYLELFPPIERYDINQSMNIDDCYFVSGCLTDMMKNPTAFSQLIQMFSENENGDISIEFKGTLKDYSPVIFENGKLKVIDGQVSNKKVYMRSEVEGAKGIQMLEQSYALSTFSKENNLSISEIDIDRAIPSIDSGFQYEVYQEILGVDANTEIMVNQNCLENNKEYIENIVEPLFNNYVSSKNSFGNIDTQYEECMFDIVSELYNFAHSENDIFKLCLNDNGEPNVEKFKQLFYNTTNLKYANFLEKNDENYLSNLISEANETKYFEKFINYSKATQQYDNLMKNNKNNTELYDLLFALKYYNSNCNLEEMQNVGLYKFLSEKTLNNMLDEISNSNDIYSLSIYIENKEYNIVPYHAYSIEKIDTKNELVYIINPHYSGGQIAIPYNIIEANISNIVIDRGKLS